MRKLVDEKLGTNLFSNPDTIFDNVNVGGTSDFTTEFASATIASFSANSSSFTSMGLIGNITVTVAEQTEIDAGTEHIFKMDYELTLTAFPDNATFQFNIAEGASSTDVNIGITELSGTIYWTARSYTVTPAAHTYVVSLEGRTTTPANPTTGSGSFTNGILGPALHQQTSDTILLGGTLHGLVGVGRVGQTAITYPVAEDLNVYYATSNIRTFPASPTYTSFYTKTFTAGETVAIDEELFRYIADSEKEVYYKFRLESSTVASGTFDLKLGSVNKN